MYKVNNVEKLVFRILAVNGCARIKATLERVNYIRTRLRMLCNERGIGHNLCISYKHDSVYIWLFSKWDTTHLNRHIIAHLDDPALTVEATYTLNSETKRKRVDRDVEQKILSALGIGIDKPLSPTALESTIMEALRRKKFNVEG